MRHEQSISILENELKLSRHIFALYGGYRNTTGFVFVDGQINKALGLYLDIKHKLPATEGAIRLVDLLIALVGFVVAVIGESLLGGVLGATLGVLVSLFYSNYDPTFITLIGLAAGAAITAYKIMSSRKQTAALLNMMLELSRENNPVKTSRGSFLLIKQGRQ